MPPALIRRCNVAYTLQDFKEAVKAQRVVDKYPCHFDGYSENGGLQLKGLEPFGAHTAQPNPWFIMYGS